MNPTHHSRKDSAVSPIVGVMLTLMITVMIAGVVGVFAMTLIGGSVDVSNIQATATFDDNNDISILITQCDEDLVADDLELSLTYVGPTTTRQIIDFPEGEVFSGEMISTEINLTSDTNDYLIVSLTNKTRYDIEKANNRDRVVKLPADKNPPSGLFSRISWGVKWVTWSLSHITSDNKFVANNLIQQGIRYELIPSGSTITISIKHIPSGKIIYNKDVIFVDVTQNEE